MEKSTWNSFKKTKERFRQYTDELTQSLPQLKSIQQELVNNRSEVSYIVQTPVVYNSALDDVTINDEIKLILVADNPGRREQMSENRRYLVGPSGKIAKKFFNDNPSLGIDFLKNVIILNKTPIHTPRTVELRELCNLEARKHRGHGEDKKCINLAAAIEQSQNIMAQLLYEFHEALDCPVWITGYSEMKKNGIFEVYTERIKELYTNKERKKELFIYRHFSMNQFTIDLKKQAQPGESVTKALNRIGKGYRDRILNC